MKNINTKLWSYDTFWGTFDVAEMVEEFEQTYGYNPSEEELSNFCDETNDRYLDDLFEEIRAQEAKHGEKHYVILAVIGRWNGPADGGKVIKGLGSVLSECSSDYNTFYYENSQLRVTAHHHDGTNHFRVRELTEAGEQYIENHPYMSDRELHKRLFNSTRYSRMVQLFPKLYGLI